MNENYSFLKEIIEKCAKLEISVEFFCKTYENYYNFKMNFDKNTEKQNIFLENLFVVVVRYSSFLPEVDNIIYYSDSFIINKCVEFINKTQGVDGC